MGQRVRLDHGARRLFGLLLWAQVPAQHDMRHPNRGGNRQANAALYRAVIVRMRWHAPTIAYVERRTADGLSKKDIIRCLKRFLARELFQLLPDVSAAQAPVPVARAA